MARDMVWGNVKLGRIKSHEDPRTFRASKYLQSVPSPPASVDYSQGVRSLPVFGNADVGDCTTAASGHMIECWTYQAQGREARITTPEVLQMYEAVSGYKPSDPSTDQGAEPINVLKYWRSTGLHGHKITAFAQVDAKNELEIKQAIWAFGGCYLGLGLPITAQRQMVWDVVPNAGPASAVGSWGGHAVSCHGWNDTGLEIVTWGQRWRMTVEFAAKYVEEAWAVVSPDWLKAGKTPQGFDLATLEADLQALGH